MTQEEIAKLPTLLDIVNHYLEGERRLEYLHENGLFKGLFPTQRHKGLYEPMLMPDGTHILMPLSPAQHSFYRGESEYHEECHPSLFRKQMTDADIFVERVKRCELERMMVEYPITNLFANSIQAQDPTGEWHPLPFRVGFDGMAQHYGIKTEFMDITVDPLTAAFFAATTYNVADDTYSPITDTDKHPYGVYYLYNEIPLPFLESKRIAVVGMQPLSRPGRQSAYVFRMRPKENFNQLAQKTFFRHDADINKEIYNRANADNRLFPNELIGTRIRAEIVNGEEFSRWAYEQAVLQYGEERDEKVLSGYLKEKNIRISITDRQWFTEAEKQQAIDYWETYQQELFSKISLRWSYRGPIKVEE